MILFGGKPVTAINRGYLVNTDIQRVVSQQLVRQDAHDATSYLPRFVHVQSVDTNHLP